MTNSVIRAAATAVGAKLLVCIGTCTSPVCRRALRRSPPRRVRLPVISPGPTPVAGVTLTEYRIAYGCDWRSDCRNVARIPSWSNAVSVAVSSCCWRSPWLPWRSREREGLDPKDPCPEPSAAPSARNRALAGRPVLRPGRDGHARPPAGRRPRHREGVHDEAARRVHGPDPGGRHRRRLPLYRDGQRGHRGGGLLQQRVVGRRAGASFVSPPARVDGTSTSHSSTERASGGTAARATKARARARGAPDLRAGPGSRTRRHPRPSPRPAARA